MNARAVAAAILVLSTSCATAPPAAVEEAFRRVDAAQFPFTTRKAEDFERLAPGYEPIVSLLPAGYWALFLDAFPDRAFSRYATRFEKGGDDAILARWALVHLAERRHRPTFDFFRGRLSSTDPYERGLAARMLAHSGDASFTPRLLALLPTTIKDGDDSLLAADLLKAAAGCRPPDPALEEALRRYGKEGSWVVSDSTRACFAVARAADPAAVAERLLFEERKEDQLLESFEEWLPEFAIRERLATLAPLLR